MSFSGGSGVVGIVLRVRLEIGRPVRRLEH